MKFIKKVSKQLKKKLHKFKYLHFDKKYTVQKPYPSTFLNEVELNQPTNTKVNKNIFCCWTGSNEMSENRKKGIQSMHEKCGVGITLVSPANIDEYILDDFPLHPAYEYLSLVHRSDYLRCYLMHHHGGGYSDVKPHFNSWSNSFDLLNSDPTKIILGYREISANCASQLVDFVSINQNKINQDIIAHYLLLLGSCSYICKPYTSFTQTWINEVHRRLDLALEELKKNPGNVMGDNFGYPLPWSSIYGQIFHPLCLLFHEQIIYNDKIKPCTDHRKYR